MKDETSSKKTANFVATKPKTYVRKVQKDDYEIEDSEFMKAERVKKASI